MKFFKLNYKYLQKIFNKFKFDKKTIEKFYNIKLFK